MSNTSLRHLNLKPSYYSDECDLAEELQIPLLSRSCYYDRGVGFFTSGWLKAVAQGIAIFASRGGRARLITSPKMQESDWLAISAASRKRKQESIEAAVLKSVDELKAALEYKTLDALSWMIVDGLLEIRFAIPTGALAGGDYHPKVAFFRDEESGWCVHGSMNDSLQAFRNAESVSVFSSDGEGRVYYQQHLERFESLWAGRVNHIEIFNASDEALAPLVEITRSSSRPYTRQPAPAKSLEASLRPYQKEAIQCWVDSGRRGILEMATGTGKTYTAIEAARQTLVQSKRLALFVVVPYDHLVEQWASDLKKAGFSPVFCKGSSKAWRPLAEQERQHLQARTISHACWVATQKTAAGEHFTRLLKQVRAPKMMIGDEVHGLGARTHRRCLEESVQFRLGLSATPRRWHDEEGTNTVFSYFGQTVYEYGITKAIQNGFLTRYRYMPVAIDLTYEELSEVSQLSKRLALALSMEDYDAAEMLARERARIINNCESIIPEFMRILRARIADSGVADIRDTLVYCAPGRHREVLRLLCDIGIRAHEFVADTAPADRAQVLDRFSKGELQCLVAVKCLDEGVDVPSTRTAYLLASSTNPREFVQRRGRILRLADGKDEAVIFDFLAASWQPVSAEHIDTARTLLRRCLPRFAEFTQDCSNRFEARQVVFESARRLNLISALDKRPWEVYRELQDSDPSLAMEGSPIG